MRTLEMSRTKDVNHIYRIKEGFLPSVKEIYEKLAGRFYEEIVMNKSPRSVDWIETYDRLGNIDVVFRVFKLISGYWVRMFSVCCR